MHLESLLVSPHSFPNIQHSLTQALTYHWLYELRLDTAQGTVQLQIFGGCIAGNGTYQSAQPRLWGRSGAEAPELSVRHSHCPVRCAEALTLVAQTSSTLDNFVFF